MKVRIFAAAGAIVAALAHAPAAQADCGEVTITEMNWASAAIVTAVSKFIMEQGYGCTVAAVPSSTVPAMTSVAETGQPDIVTEVWVNSSPVYQRLEAEGKVVTAGEVLTPGGVEGWWIPQYLVDKHPELATIDGVLANPDLVGGRFHNCPEGWACRITNDTLVKAYGFEGSGMEVFDHGSGETLATSIASAVENEEPWFGYYWGPTSVLGKYPMVMVDVGPFEAATHDCNTRPECATPGRSAYPTARVITGVTKTLYDREQEVFELMSNVSFSNETMGQVLAWQEANGASPEEAAVYFLTTHKDVWGAWLDDSARERLGALLD
ncbi:MAG: ABC transporter substrate-binding protein [Inquilinus sp.]|nr:ABC transporter substrate-binding protein [Inquilinus sp.]